MAEVQSQTYLKKLEGMKHGAELHLRFSKTYLQLLRSYSYPDGFETAFHPWSTLKEGSYLLGNAYRFLEACQNNYAHIDDQDLQLLKSTMAELQFDPKFNSNGFTDEAYGGTVTCFVSLGQGTRYYKLLHDSQKSGVREFINIVEKKINQSTESLLAKFDSEIQSLTNTGMQSDILFQAINCNNKSKVESLVKEGVSCNIKNQMGVTPLLYAIKHNCKDIIEILLNNGADVTETSPDGETPLHAAILLGETSIIDSILFKNVMDFNLINSQTKEGFTPLHIAAKKDSYNIVKCLLSHGAVYNIQDKENKTPFESTNDVGVAELLNLINVLFIEVNDGNTAILAKLQSLKADYREPVMNARNQSMKTLLMAVTDKVTAYRKIAQEIVKHI